MSLIPSVDLERLHALPPSLLYGARTPDTTQTHSLTHGVRTDVCATAYSARQHARPGGGMSERAAGLAWRRADPKTLGVQYGGAGA